MWQLVNKYAPLVIGLLLLCTGAWKLFHWQDTEWSVFAVVIRGIFVIQAIREHRHA
jgi:hypothetical protein